MSPSSINWQRLLSEVERHPIQGILIDRSTFPINIQFLCQDRCGWLENVTLPQVQELSVQGKLPRHVVRYLTETGLISMKQ